MASGTREKFDNSVVEWIDSRLPVFTMMQKEYGVFPTPKNFNYFWNFGAIASVMLVTMILTGLFLTMHYTPHVDHAFDSVERIMRDVNYGWLIRYIHMNGASFFFVAVFIHIFRGLYYGSYKQPRELLWIFGVIIFLLMMATAFLGYVLPWGQMSFWGAKVITNLFSAFPGVGEAVVTWLWGGFAIDNPTLNRFFALHYLLPFVIFAVVFLHIWALHVTGSNNPLGIEPKGPQDTIPFNPYYTIKDFFGILVFLAVYAAFIFFSPNSLGHPDNYIPANPLSTPAHIVPEWYFLPFYAMLRSITFDITMYFGVVFAGLGWLMYQYCWIKKASVPHALNLVVLIVTGIFAVPAVILGFLTEIPELAPVIAMIPFQGGLVEAKLAGVLVMFGSIALLAVLPWLDTHPVKSARFRPLFRLAVLLLVVDFIILGVVGGKPAEGIWPYIGLAATGYYFAFFLAICPWLSLHEKALPLPTSINEAVLAKKKSH